MGCHADSRSVTFGHVRCANMRLIVRICISQRIVMESRSDWCVTDAIRESWQREEREMSREEYDRLTLMQEVVASNTTGIVESVTQFQKDAVIDEYTQQLIEEGLI